MKQAQISFLSDQTPFEAKGKWPSICCLSSSQDHPILKGVLLGRGATNDQQSPHCILSALSPSIVVLSLRPGNDCPSKPVWAPFHCVSTGNNSQHGQQAECLCRCFCTHTVQGPTAYVILYPLKQLSFRNLEKFCVSKEHFPNSFFSVIPY